MKCCSISVGLPGLWRFRSACAMAVCGMLFANMLLAGCGTTRPEVMRAELIARRTMLDQRAMQRDDEITENLLTRMKAKHDAHQAGERNEPPVLDILVISGGGDRGAFGAAFLQSWGEVDDPEWRRPEFDVITGVSAGALIAPFAFLGDDESYRRIVTLFRNPKQDWAKLRGVLFFMPYTESILILPGLEREIEESLDREFVARLAADHDGRALKISTTNVDLGVPRVWNLLNEARRAIERDDFERFQTILLASNALPGAFPPRIIDDSLYVDGGVTGNVLYGQELRAGGFLETWISRYPDIEPPRMRYWVLFNNKYRPAPQVTRLRWFDVVDRSTTMSTRAATMTAIRHLHALAEIARLRHGVDVDVRIASIPSTWVRPAPGRFNAESMNDLADMGERMGSDPASWSLEPPP
jgi:hypothetical protein